MNDGKQANTQCHYTVKKADLRDDKLCCPSRSMDVWNSHPRVYLPITEAEDGGVVCPYCSAKYTLVDD